jgi:ketosteroid isomerase-like protein
MTEHDRQASDELRACFVAYEAALIARDLVQMAAFFSDDETVVRFGIGDRQRGAKELAAWRAAQPPLPDGRTLHETTVTTFGSDFGVVSTLFTYPDRPFLGRQSQTWVRTDGSWKIVHAHVSEIPAAALPGP